ncbi:MAG: glycerol-3-phosphate 1-O-acyltransferase PlsY [Pseudomonadota bacterium]
MLNTFFALIMVAVAYLLGSISSAILVSKFMQLPDPRASGSGNPGATNVLRVGGKRAGAITLLGDLLKGLIPVVLARVFGFSEAVIAMTALAAFLGHLFPVYFGFKGGKGVATGLGVLLGLSPALAGIVLTIWLLILALFRYSSLAALTAVVLGLIFAWGEIPADYYIVYVIITLAILWRHRANIVRLLNGTETKVGQR